MRREPLKVLAVLGTRPEVIKLAPVLRLLEKDKDFRLYLCATAQHRELLDQMLRVFGLKPHLDLDLMRPGQSPGEVLSRALASLERLISREKPGLLLVQGDTTTVWAAALAAFHEGVPIAHVEAGLRTGDLARPYPEEANRILTDRLSALLFAPTPLARANLIREGIDPRKIFVTGNTAVDSILWAVRHPRPWACRAVASWAVQPGPIAVITLHRREIFGKPLEELMRALLKAAKHNPHLRWVFPVHPTPQVLAAANRLLRHPRILLAPPLDYLDFVRLMKRCDFIVTDSGGIQEEAPSLGKPVLVVREKTERPEALGGGNFLAGISGKDLQKALSRKLKLPKSNPFGDGRAAQRIVAAIKFWAGLGRRPADFPRV